MTIWNVPKFFIGTSTGGLLGHGGGNGGTIGGNGGTIGYGGPTGGSSNIIGGSGGGNGGKRLCSKNSGLNGAAGTIDKLLQ